MAAMEGMNRTTLRVLYAVAVSIQCLCIGIVLFYAVCRSGRGPWGFYLLGSMAIGVFSRKAHTNLKKPIPN